MNKIEELLKGKLVRCENNREDMAGYLTDYIHSANGDDWIILKTIKGKYFIRTQTMYNLHEVKAKTKSKKKTKTKKHLIKK